MSDPLLSIEGVSKSYSVPVLTGVHLELGQGEIHGLVGENGAGKSTLLNILSGVIRSDTGRVLLRGTLFSPADPRQALASGVALATQELSIIPTLTVAENLCLASLPASNGFVDRNALAGDARRLLDGVGLTELDPDMLAGSLTLPQQQLVEFATAAESGSTMLMLDEPTAALPRADADRLHEVIRQLAAQGTAVVYVSHRLDDVLDIADRISVLRDGEIALTAAADSLDKNALIAGMTGRTVSASERSPAQVQCTDQHIEVSGITTNHLPHPLTFACARGEILGIAGLAGAGKTELLSALFGLDELTAGIVKIASGQGTSHVRSVVDAINAGAGLVTEDRKRSGIFPGMSVRENVMLPHHGSNAAALITHGDEVAAIRQLFEVMDIRCRSTEQRIEELSGGNQQKAALARWLNAGSKLLLLDEPTRGVDVEARQKIYELLFDLQSDGRTIIVASSELEELTTLCSRILVLSNRTLTAEFTRGNWNESAILSAAFSAHVSGGQQETGQLAR